MSEIKLTGLKDVVAWLECQPHWSGVAVRRVDDPPIPGEPFISMDAAKHLVISAVSIMDNRRSTLERELAEAREALKPFADAYVHREEWAEDSYIGGSDLRNRIDRRRRGAYANKGE